VLLWRTRQKLYFGTLTYSNATTGSLGQKYMFRECYNAWMGAKVLSQYLKNNFKDKNFFYITANYTWGKSTEKSIRKFSGTNDKLTHRSTLTKFPGATKVDFRKALKNAERTNAKVLVLVLFGSDMAEAIQIATEMGLKKKMQIIVPNLTLGMAKSAGPEAMEGVIGSVPWSWQVPYLNNINSAAGKSFVEKYAKKYDGYPSSAAASAYSILYQYKNAVEKANSFDSEKIIEKLEGNKYTHLKDEQQWRYFDHQNIQTVFAVKCKPASHVVNSKFQEDYFEIIDSMPGTKAARTFKEWSKARKDAGKENKL
jgi:branched-chain amino acid transport system substrate-binding protein